MLKEFKEFAMRGNVVDLAVGVIIGAAFGKIVSSLVEDVIMPPIGRLLGHVDFSALFINLSSTHYASIDAARHAIPPQPTLNYGIFFRLFRGFLGSPTNESPHEKAGSPRRAHDQRLPAVRDGDSPCGEALRTLHDAARMRKRIEAGDRCLVPSRKDCCGGDRYSTRKVILKTKNKKLASFRSSEPSFFGSLQGAPAGG